MSNERITRYAVIFAGLLFVIAGLLYVISVLGLVAKLAYRLACYMFYTYPMDGELSKVGEYKPTAISGT